MKIAFVAPRYPPEMDGVGDHAAKLAHALSRLGNDVVVITTGDLRPANPVEVRIVGRTWSLGAARRAAAIVRATRADTVVMEYTPFLFGGRSFAPLILPILCRVPTFAFVHEIFYTSGTASVKSRWKKTYFESRDRAVLAVCRGIFVPNIARRDRILANVGNTYASKITIAPIGSNLEPSAGQEWSPDARNGHRKRIVTFGVVAGRRRLERAIDALAILKGRNVDAELRIVGRIWDQPYADACRERAREAGVSELVTFTGSLPESAIADEFLRADAVAYMAAEGLTSSAGSLLAAFAYGAPVLATRNPGDEDRLSAVVTLADDTAEDFADAFVGAFARPNDIAKRATAAKELYRSTFGWDASAATIRSRLANEI
jgi:glycosyltransferase involved in cell wall biosynthesis